MIQCLILEDEKAAQVVLTSYIEKTPFINCLGIYESGLDIPTADLQKADLLFLDIQLPELSGISYLKTLTNPPIVIVTTAYHDYAIDAFEEAVVDYLVKPFSYERFYKAVNRIRQQVELNQKSPENHHLFLNVDKTIYRIDVNDILYLKAEVDYVKLVTKNKNLMFLDSLRNWEKKLEGFTFLRVHRSYIINLLAIDKVQGNQIYLADTIIPIGKTYKASFLEQIGKL